MIMTRNNLVKKRRDGGFQILAVRAKHGRGNVRECLLCFIGLK